MAHYNGPRLRKIRRFGSELPGLTTKTAARKPTPPGHAAAASRRFRKLSEHGLRLRETQKLRFHYNVTKKAMRRIYERAKRMQGDAGHNLIELLEARLDNLVWRAGLTRTIPAARQLVAHGHVLLDDHRAKTPSQRVAVGSTFRLVEKTLNREDIRISVNNPVLDPPSGLKRDLDKLAVTVESLPTFDQIPFDIDIQKVIEFFAR